MFGQQKTPRVFKTRGVFCPYKSLKMDTITIKSDLQKTSVNPTLKTKLSNRAKQAEKDIVAGRIFKKDEIVHLTNRASK